MNTASFSRRQPASVLRAIFATACVAAAAPAFAATNVTLCAEPYAQDLPGRPGVPMWGYRRVANALACDTNAGIGTASPGPLLALPVGDARLNITLVNKLTVPTSLVIASQSLPTEAGTAMAPVMAADLVGPSCVPNPSAAASAAAHPQNCRVRSFTGETAPGASRTYTFDNLRPGTYLYQSGTHQQVQIQMGLFGMVKQDATVSGNPYRLLHANPAAAFDVDVPVVLSEVDADQHDRIASTLGSADPGTWKAGNNSTLNYRPKFFLINGKTFALDGSGPQATTDLPVAISASAKVVFRIANAGLMSRSLMLNSGTWQLQTEDGYPYPAAREQATTLVPAGKTTDALLVLTPPASGVTRSLALFDRRGGTDNGDGTALGGQVARVALSTAGQQVNQPPAVSAGVTQDIYTTAAALPTVPISLAGSVVDDSVALPLNIQWTLVSGPGTATFVSAASPATTVRVSATGTYVFRLTASDPEFTVARDVTVNVYVPTVNAGAAQTIAVANAPGVNNNPRVPATLAGQWSGFSTTPTFAWTRVSGPGGNNGVQFTSTTLLQTTANLSAVGTYVLRLTATAGAISASSDVTVTVVANKHAADLDWTVMPGANGWSATVTVKVENALHAALNNVTVSANWNGTSGENGSTGGGQNSTSCTTGAAGTCQLTRTGISNNRSGITFAVAGMNGSNTSGNFDATASHDPDDGSVANQQASDGRNATIAKPPTPTVAAGAGQTVNVGIVPTLVAPVVFALQDASLTNFDGSQTLLWTANSGNVSFTPNATSLQTSASVSAAGTYTLALTATQAGQAYTGTKQLTVNANKHVAAMTGSSPTAAGGTPWTATAVISVTNALGEPVSGVVVNGSWSNNGNAATCTTDAVGICTVSRTGMNRNQTQSTTFTVSNSTSTNNGGLTGVPSVGAYAPSANVVSSVSVTRP